MRKLGVSLCLVLFAAGTAWPQAGVSTVRGVVEDPSHAVVPKATIRLTNTDTNVTRTTQTNDVGLYIFPDVIPGPYRITMEASGLNAFQATLTVFVLQEVRVDGVLALGTSATQVEVKDVSQMVQTDSATLFHGLERQRIEQLPINGRSYQNRQCCNVAREAQEGLGTALHHLAIWNSPAMKSRRRPT